MGSQRDAETNDIASGIPNLKTLRPLVCEGDNIRNIEVLPVDDLRLIAGFKCRFDTHNRVEMLCETRDIYLISVRSPLRIFLLPSG